MMKRTGGLLLYLSIPMVLISSDTSLKIHTKKHVKEDQEWGLSEINQLFERGWNSGFQKNDILPDEDKGKEFSHENLDEMFACPPQSKNALEVSNVTGLQTKNKYEGTEPFFSPSHSILENPTNAVGITSKTEHLVPEEITLATCQEVGTYQISFLQKRDVVLSPEENRQIRHCREHLIIDSEKFFFKSGAEDAVKKKKKELAKDGSLEAYNVYPVKDNVLGRYAVVSQLKHKDNTSICNNYFSENIVIRPSSESDLWKTDYPEDLSLIEGNPNCKLLYSQVIEGPEVRSVGEKSVFRDIWSRRLYFSCEPDANSPCNSLRAKGGVLIKKRCLKETPFGECDLWEKTYDLGSKGSYKEYVLGFKDEELWGLNDAFDSTYDKNNELPSVVASLSIFSDLKKGLEKSEQISEEKIEIFRGEEMKCQCSFIKGVLYDCCKKMDGLAVATYLAACNSQEQSLAQKRHEGKCHHVGSLKENLGTQTSQIFCCFDTKLARILQEQGREQLQIEWGKAERPECRGFSLKELQTIDFTKVDFSDAIEDLSINKEDLLARIRSTVENLQLSGQSQGRIKTDTLIHKQEECIRNAP